MSDRLQIQPDPASCFITSIAMVMNIPVAQLIEEVGVDHMSILHPGRPGSYMYRGHHIQDLTETLLNHGWVITPNWAKYPISHMYPKGCIMCGGSGKFKGKWVEGNLLISRANGVMQYQGHSCAWIDGQLYNPCGKIQEFHTTLLVGFHPLFKVNQNESLLIR